MLRSTAEGLIASSRALLGALFLLAVGLDPSEPSKYASLAYTTLATYVVYAFVVAAILRRNIASGNLLQVSTHAVDMLVFSVIVFLTGGPNSPFFVYFIFLLVVSAMRWQWRGTLWTAAGVMVIAAAMAWYPPALLQNQEFELNRYIIRLAYLAVVAMLLGYLGAHESKLGGILSQLSSSPQSVGPSLQELAQQALQQAAGILDAPRAILLWEEEDEPWLHLATWTRDSFTYDRQPPGSLGLMLAEPLAESTFFCHDTRLPQPLVILKNGEVLEKWHGVPLLPPLPERFDVTAVLCTRWRGEKSTGYLLALDKPDMNAEDLMLAEIVSQRAADRFDLYFTLQRMQQAAASDERVRLARDLHDGLLQSLTAAALQLEAAYRQMETDPQLAQERVRQIQGLIIAEQRGLRSHIQQLRPVVPRKPELGPELPASMDELAARIERHWGLHVEMKTERLDAAISPQLAREIYFLVHECLINAAHHARATSARAVISMPARDRLKILVHDNGRGFSFQGKYDLDALNAMHAGPLTLKERISRLGGSLVLTSTEAGSMLEIFLSVAEEGGCNADNSSAG